MAFGIVNSSAGVTRVEWLEHPVPVTPELLELTAPLPPAQVLRFSAPCAEKACCHFDGADCRLATNLVQLLPSVPSPLPPCQIRPDCRWFVQEGRAACARCPQIVTASVEPTPELSLAAAI